MKTVIKMILSLLILNSTLYGLTKEDLSIMLEYNKQAIMYYKLAKFNESKKYFLNVIEMQEEILDKNHPLLAKNYNNISLVYQNLGDLENALVFAKKSLNIRENTLNKNSPDLATTYSNIALIYISLKDLQNALIFSKKALNIDKKVNKNNPNLAISYNNLSAIYKNLGDLQNALKFAQKALNIFEKVLDKNHPNLLMSYSNISVIYRNLKDSPNALKFAMKALKIRERIFRKNHPAMALSYGNISVIYQNLGDMWNSLIFAKKALKIREEILDKNHPNLATSYNIIAVTYRHLGDLQNSLKFAKKALEIREKKFTKNHSDIAISYSNISLVYRDLGDLKNAYKYIRQSFNIFINNRDINFAILDKTQKSSYLKSKKSFFNNFFNIGFLYSNKKPKIKNQILNNWLNYKRTIYDTQNSLNLIYSKGDKTINAKIDKLYNAQRRLARLYQNVPQKSNKLEAYNQQIKSTQEEISRLEIWLSEKSSNLYTQDINYHDIAKRLKKDELYIDFARVGKQYYYFTLDKAENIEFEAFNENLSKEIDNKIAYIGEEVHKHNNRVKNRGFAKLYDLIIKNIDLKDKKSLIISPDGVLGLVPFEAFYNLQTKQYLIEDFRVRYIPSGKELVRLYSNKNHSTENIMVFANPNYGLELKSQSDDNSQRGIMKALKDNSFEYLEGSQKEADNIGSILREDITQYIEDEASEKNLFKIHSPKILHLSTHGFFLDDKNISNPLMKSGIALSGANYAIKNKTGNGIVTGLELAGVDLKGTELVVLSACKTGLGDIEDAEGVAGLSKAFMLAGAKQVIMSLWNVDDKATTELMRLFYENIKKGLSYSEALREAKLLMIQKATRYAHPYFWSGFVGSGV